MLSSHILDTIGRVSNNIRFVINVVVSKRFNNDIVQAFRVSIKHFVPLNMSWIWMLILTRTTLLRTFVLHVCRFITAKRFFFCKMRQRFSICCDPKTFFTMAVVLLRPHDIFLAIFESGKIDFANGTRWSLARNAVLCSVPDEAFNGFVQTLQNAIYSSDTVLVEAEDTVELLADSHEERMGSDSQAFKYACFFFVRESVNCFEDVVAWAGVVVFKLARAGPVLVFSCAVAECACTGAVFLNLLLLLELLLYPNCLTMTIFLILFRMLISQRA